MVDLDPLASIGATLRHLRKRRGLTQAGVADALQVERPTISQWEADRHLPSSARARALDDLLGADGALCDLIEHHREQHAPHAADARAVAASDLLTVFRGVQAALETHLQRDADGQPLGWCQNLNTRSAPTPVTTAFGIKTLSLIDETSASDLARLGQRLRDMAGADGGWRASAQTGSSPEATAVVAGALVRVHPTEPVARLLDLIEHEIDDIARQRPAILTTILETVVDLRPGSSLTDKLIRDLLAIRTVPDRRGRLLWGEKSAPNLVSPAPTVPHTARAVAILARARTAGWVGPDLATEVDDALDTGTEWLTGQAGVNSSEYIERPLSDWPGKPATAVPGAAPSIFIFRHFTEAWVARALLLAGVSVHHPRVTAALANVWRSYNAETALWRWDDGDIPVWMTLDAVTALRLAALTSFPAP